MALNQTGFFNGFQIRTKVSITVAIIFALMICILTIYNVKRESARMLEGIQKEVKDMNTMYFDSLNTMMLTGTMDQRDILNKKVLSRDGVIDARVIRGKPVKDQFGPGLPGSQPVDELDTLALSGKEIQKIVEKDGQRILTVITPFKATEDTRGVNCLQCHNVKAGAVNGAVRISYSLAELDKVVRHEMWMSIGGGAAFLILSLLFLNLFFKAWVINPLKNLMDTVNRRAKGDMSARVVIKSSNDEIGKVANAFNEMSDTMDEAAAREYELTQREQEAAKTLRTKIDKLLLVVNRVAEGDFSAEVNFAGEGSIGDLAKQLQNMINHIRKFSQEREQTLESLQYSVDNILSVVTMAAKGDLTGQIDTGGDGAIAQLGSGIQQMINNLNTLARQVQHSGIQLASAVTSIVATSKEQEATASEQAATANEIVTTAAEISAISKELVSTMDEVSGVADNTAKSAESGRLGLERMESVMGRIVGAIGPISSKFEVLNEKAGNISSVVTTITKVADQTNLLSLNAAIEAEKAGEFGFGFSVVAKEIRRLADQTAVSTLDIEQMVKEMQAAVSAGVMSMDRFSQQVRHNVKDVTEVSSQLAQIIGQVETLTPLVESVHQGMHSQSEGASQISQSMILLHEATEQTVEALRESNDAIMQLDIAANDLQSGVSKFKVRMAFDH